MTERLDELETTLENIVAWINNLLAIIILFRNEETLKEILKATKSSGNNLSKSGKDFK